MTGNRIHIVKISASVILIIVSLWALFLPPLFPSSTRALVNTSVYRINAPIAGKIKQIVAEDRERLEANAPIAILERDQDKTIEEIALLKLDIAQTQLELDAVRSTLLQQDEQSSERVSSQLEKSRYELNLFKQQVQDAQTAYAIAQQSESKITDLFDQNVVTFADLQQARAATLDARKRLTDLDREVDSLERSIKTLSNTGAENQTTNFSFQDSQTKSLSLREVALSAETQASEQRLEQLVSLMDSGAEQTITAIRGGILWQANVIEDQPVSRGDPLFIMARADNLFVEAYLARHFLDSVAIGDRAVIYLNDDKSFHEGIVTSIQAQEQDEARQYAIPSVAPNLFTLKLTIQLREKSIGIDQLGRLAKVIITSAKPSLAERILVRLSLALRAST